MKPIVWHLQYWLMRALACPLALTPVSLLRPLGRTLGYVLWIIWSSRRRYATEQIRLAVAAGGLPKTLDPVATARESFMNLGHCLAEVLKVHHGLGGGIIGPVKIRGIENIEKARAKGKGVLFVTGHCGNWELLGSVVSAKIAPVMVVARELNNPLMEKMLLRSRQRFGNVIVHKRGALRALLKRFRAGGMGVILMDQAVVPEEGIITDFLGRPAWTLKVPAIIAKRAECPVLPFFMHREGGTHVVEIGGEIPVTGDEAVDTKAFSRPVEDFIRAHPPEWLWIHRRWKRAGEGDAPI